MDCVGDYDHHLHYVLYSKQKAPQMGIEPLNILSATGLAPDNEML